MKKVFFFLFIEFIGRQEPARGKVAKGDKVKSLQVKRRIESLQLLLRTTNSSYP